MTLYLFFPFAREFWRSPAFSQSTKPGLGQRASYLFFLGWCTEMLLFVCLLSILQSQTSWLCVIASCLQKFTLAIHRTVHGSWLKWKWSVQSIEGAHRPVRRDSMLGFPSSLFEGLLDGVHEGNIRISDALLSSSKVWYLGLHFSALLSDSPKHFIALIPSVFWVPFALSIQGRWEKVNFVDCVPHSWGKQALTMFSLFPVDKSEAEGVCLSWHWTVLPWKIVTQVNWHSSSYPL